MEHVICGKIAIAGNPNSGKTTMFNVLSGKNERIGNWAGVTVTKKEALLKKRYNFCDEGIVIVDLPGAYGMEAYTNDEYEAVDFIRDEEIDVIINVVDASNLERSLFFTSQLIDTGIPVVIALNKSDVTKRRKTKIDVDKLSNILGSDVYFTQATSKKGIKDVIKSAIEKIGENDFGQESTKERKYKRHNFSSTRKECGCK